MSRQGDPIVLGVAVNLLALGLTSFLLPQLFGVRGVFQHPRVDGLDRIRLPLLSEIPVPGPALFSTTVPAYLAMAAVPVLWVFLFRTPLGLRLRGVGERPVSAETLGVSSTRYKYAAVVAVMLGRAHPVGVLGASALFGLAEGLGFRLQGNGLPVQITDALPYVATLIALAIARKRFKRILELTAA